MTNQIQISHSLYTPILGQTIVLSKGWPHGRVHMNCQSSLSFPLMFKNCVISLINCQSSLPDSLCSNITQLGNNNYITVCFKQIKRYKKVCLLTLLHYSLRDRSRSAYLPEVGHLVVALHRSGETRYYFNISPGSLSTIIYIYMTVCMQCRIRQFTW